MHVLDSRHLIKEDGILYNVHAQQNRCSYRDDDGGPGANDRGFPHKKEIENKQHEEM